MSILDRMREVDVGEWIAERRGRLAAWSASAILAGAVAAGGWWWVEPSTMSVVVGWGSR